MQKKSKHTSLTAKNKSLSVQCSLDGFSFCIKDVSTKKEICLTQYLFKETLTTPRLLLEKIEHIFSTETLLQQEFETVEVIHQNNLSTLVPTKFFDENKLKTYLDFNIKTLATDFIAFDDLQQSSTKNVYVPYVNINNYIFQNFGAFEYKHHATVLIDKLLHQTKNQLKRHFFVHVNTNNFDVVYIENSNLKLYNNFAFTTKEDFIYYILFTAEQLGLNPDEFALTFIGNIEEESDIYKITYKYIRNISFFKPAPSFFNPSDEFSPHSNFLLLS